MKLIPLNVPNVLDISMSHNVNKFAPLIAFLKILIILKSECSVHKTIGFIALNFLQFFLIIIAWHEEDLLKADHLLRDVLHILQDYVDHGILKVHAKLQDQALSYVEELEIRYNDCYYDTRIFLKPLRKMRALHYS